MEKLSEQLAFADLVAFSSAGSLTSSTGNAIDARLHHNLVAMAIASTVSVTATSNGTGTISTTATASFTFTFTIQASTSTGFTNPTTVASSSSITRTATATTTSTGGATTTATVSLEDGVEYDIDCAAVQAARAAEDRYVRAIISAAAGSGTPAITMGLVYADTARYKASPRP